MRFGRQPWIWVPRRTVRASCLLTRPGPSGDPRHEAPGEECRCGYYASSQVDKLRQLFMHQRSPFIGRRALSLCVGEVACWGKVVRHERGLRSRFAYPSRLFLRGANNGSEMIGTELASEYGVPITIVPPDLATTWGTSEWAHVVEEGLMKEIPVPVTSTASTDREANSL